MADELPTQTAAGQGPRRRRPANLRPTSTSGWLRAALFMGAVAVLAAVLVLAKPSEKGPGVVGRASKYLTSSSFFFLPSTTSAYLADRANSSSSSSSTAEDDGGRSKSSASKGEAGESDAVGYKDGGNTSSAEQASEEGSGGLQVKAEERFSSTTYDNGEAVAEETSSDGDSTSSSAQPVKKGGGSTGPAVEKSSSEIAADEESSNGGAAMAPASALAPESGSLAPESTDGGVEVAAADEESSSKAADDHVETGSLPPESDDSGSNFEAYAKESSQDEVGLAPDSGSLPEPESANDSSETEEAAEKGSEEGAGEVENSGTIKLGGEESSSPEPAVEQNHIFGAAIEDNDSEAGTGDASGTIVEEEAASEEGGSEAVAPESSPDGTGTAAAGSGRRETDGKAGVKTKPSPPADTSDPTCKQSGYCSVGKLKAYVGEVDTTKGLKAALKACSYKKDFFLITIGPSDHLLGMNFVAGAWRLGLANVMLHASDRESCAKLAEAGYTNVTCVWSERDWFPHKANKFGVEDKFAIWAVRYIIMARSVWLGYNVWLLDTDSYLFRDPYQYVKAPPFKDITWMSLNDNDATIVNGGASYIQNAAPGGPAAWALAHMCERMIRVNEKWVWYAKASNVTDENFLGHAMMDQFVLSDVIAGSFLRHPYVRFTLFSAPDLAPNIEDRLTYGQPGVHLSYPPEWAYYTFEEGGRQGHVQGFNLTIPYLDGKWDTTIGGKRFTSRGNYSKAFIKLLEQESGHTYADIEGPTPKGWVSPPNETFIFTPNWLLDVWLRGGYRGTWSLVPPPQIMVHIVFMAGWSDPAYQKMYGLKSIHAFHFEVAEALQGHPFPTATAEQPLPRVLALMPGVRLAGSLQEYRGRLSQLVRLAHRLGRVLLLPDPYCSKPNSTFLNNEDTGWAVRGGHWRQNADLEQLLPYGLDEDQHCLWLHAQEVSCMPGAYILHLDYLELLRRLPEGSGKPGPGNTVQLTGGVQKKGKGAGAGKVQGRGQAVSWAAAAEAAKGKSKPHVLFLSAVPDLRNGSVLAADWGKADAWWEKWVADCGWTREPEQNLLPPKGRRRLSERPGDQQQWPLGLWDARQRHLRSEAGPP